LLAQVFTYKILVNTRIVSVFARVILVNTRIVSADRVPWAVARLCVGRSLLPLSFHLPLRHPLTSPALGPSIGSLNMNKLLPRKSPFYHDFRVKVKTVTWILDEGLRGGGPSRSPFWRTPEDSCKGLGSVSFKINTQHTHRSQFAPPTSDRQTDGQREPKSDCPTIGDRGASLTLVRLG
jgi:hypothetical protein